ncbi:MAG TPA: hypothetical protein VH599_22370 [Ktedonobacterales bacterium]
MSHTLTISDRAYETLQALASKQGKTLEAFLESWAEQHEPILQGVERNPYTDPRYQTFEEFFHELGVSEERLRRLEEEAEAEDDANV